MRLLSSFEASVLSAHGKVNTTNTEGTRTVLDELKAKHPSWNKVNPDAVLPEPERVFHDVVFNCSDAESIQKGALRRNAGARPSGVT